MNRSETLSSCRKDRSNSQPLWLVCQASSETASRDGPIKHILSGYGDGVVRTVPVGSYEANPWGLHDLSGNVSEWTADGHDETYYGKSPEHNPKGPSSGQYRVLRGGSWSDLPGDVRSAGQGDFTPSRGVDDLGFRCAQDVPK